VSGANHAVLNLHILDQELDRLGPSTVRFELQPFASAELRAYAQGCFSGLLDAGHHVMEFMSGLRRSGLHSLACTPLKGQGFPTVSLLSAANRAQQRDCWKVA